MNSNERLKYLRKNKLNLTQDEMANALGVKRTSYCMIENGKRNLRDNHIKVLVSHYNVNELWIRNGEGDVFNTNPMRNQFIELLESLPPSIQKYFIDIMREYIDLQKEEAQLSVVKKQDSL